MKFLFPPKSSMLEVFICSILTFANGSLLSFALHPNTLEYFFEGDASTGPLIIGLVISGLSSYCLFSAHCPESAIYRDNDIYFGFGSNHYQRVVSNIVISVLIAVTQSLLTKFLYWMYLIVYILQVFGILSHPVVTMLWFME